MMKTFNAKIAFPVSVIVIVIAAPQRPENNDEYETVTYFKNVMKKVNDTMKPINGNTNVKNEVVVVNNNNKLQNLTRRSEANDLAPSLYIKLYRGIATPVIRIISAPKVKSVLRNIGTCAVNGALEIITYYLPAPLIPLIAAAAGMLIPFEPVVLLKEKMPVTSYRRAFNTAMKGFLNTFDDINVNSMDDDPYMTRRFNRRFMNDVSDEKGNKRY